MVSCSGATHDHQLAVVEELCPAVRHSTAVLKLKTGAETADIARAFLGVGRDLGMDLHTVAGLQVTLT